MKMAGPFAMRALRGVLCLSLLVAGACATPPKRRVAVDIEKRSTPAQPQSAGRPNPAEPRTKRVVMSTQTLRGTLGGIAADTASARTSLTKCRGRKLLPDQDAVFESTTRLLMDVRGALSIADFRRAQSLARQAKQLAGSLGCR